MLNHAYHLYPHLVICQDPRAIRRKQSTVEHGSTLQLYQILHFCLVFKRYSKSFIPDEYRAILFSPHRHFLPIYKSFHPTLRLISLKVMGVNLSWLLTEWLFTATVSPPTGLHSLPNHRLPYQSSNKESHIGATLHQRSWVRWDLRR